MTSKMTFKYHGATYRFLVRIDTKKEFPDDIKETLNKVRRNKKLKSHIIEVSDTYMIISPKLFDKLQERLDVSRSCTASLLAQNISSTKDKKRKVLIHGAKMYGSDKDLYDEMLRLLRYK